MSSTFRSVQGQPSRYTNEPLGIGHSPLGNQGGAILYFKPKTLDEAIHSLATSGSRILSGGTDFFPALSDRPVYFPVVDISAVEGIKGITIEPEWIRIGGLTTWSEILRAPLPRCLDALRSAAREVGSIQIQNRGTIAGNLCNASPAADGVPPLMALDAEVELVSVKGVRRMPLADFLVGSRKTALREDEILTHILIPRQLEGAASAFLKLGARRYLVISIAMVAVVVKADYAGCVMEARVVVGSCSAKAQRLRRLELDLIGMPLRSGIGAIVSPAHLAPLSAIDDVRATAVYRRDASCILIQRALEACVGY